MLFQTCTSSSFKSCLQLKQAIDKRSAEIRKIEKRINEIVDRIYKDFSKSVGVANIREYEENQLKASQYMAEERLSLSSQLSKLKYQYVLASSIYLSVNKCKSQQKCQYKRLIRFPHSLYLLSIKEQIHSNFKLKNSAFSLLCCF